MQKTSAQTLETYLAELPEERRAVISDVRDLILRHLPQGYVEGFHWGMLSYVIPLARFPNTYNRQPLMYLALAANSKDYSLYLMCVYQDPAKMEWLKEEFHQAGKKLKMGKSCLHFRSLDDLPLDAIGQLIASTPADEYIAQYERLRKK